MIATTPRFGCSNRGVRFIAPVTRQASGVHGREELLQPAVRQRMSEQPFDCRKGACRHIGTRIETLDNMLRMTDRSGQHLRFVTIGAVDLHDVATNATPSSEMSSRRPTNGDT